MLKFIWRSKWHGNAYAIRWNIQMFWWHIHKITLNYQLGLWLALQAIIKLFQNSSLAFLLVLFV